MVKTKRPPGTWQVCTDCFADFFSLGDHLCDTCRQAREREYRQDFMERRARRLQEEAPDD